MFQVVTKFDFSKSKIKDTELNYIFTELFNDAFWLVNNQWLLNW